MKRKLSIYTAVIVIATFMIAIGCRKEKFLSSGGDLRFSVDTLKFDTVFTSLGSFTAQVKIYNPQNQKIKLSSIKLDDLSGNTPFIINVSGTSGDAENIEIAAHDSIYVFATVNIDPTNADIPFVVEDNLVATLNGKRYVLPFRAYGQNAYYLVDSLIINNQTWKTDKPYVIIKNAAVDENVTVTIPAGCRVYMHADSRLIVLGTLKIKGTKKDSVIFQGDRLDRGYFGEGCCPGEWGGLYFTTTSRDNEINYAVLKNVGNTTRLGESTFTPAAIQLNYDTIGTGSGADFYQLRMTNTVIENSIGYGILAFGSTLFAQNCLINTCGAQCMAAFEGGRYDMDNCTFVTYGTNRISHIDNPVMALLNYRDISSSSYVVGPLYCTMTNCVVWGSLETEFLAQGRGDINADSTKFLVELNNCLVKNKDGMPKDVKATNTKVNEDPQFKDYANWNYHPNGSSPLVNAGIPVPGLTTDLDGKARDGQPDIGCYEY